MKFCKNLQRVVDISDPEWAPFWPNYKMLKKLIKELPSLVPSDESKVTSAANKSKTDGDSIRNPDSPVLAESSSVGDRASLRQQHGDKTAEKSGNSSNKEQQDEEDPRSQPQNAGSMSKSPGEVAFFKLLHAEFKKASHFFDRATEEFTIREERVREGMNIMKQPNSIMVTEKWSLVAKSIYRLYKDLLLLETFAIMTYCSFSKILKKHDKVTRYETRIAFMSNIVNKANFTNYPSVMEMIDRCERLYADVSGHLLREGKEGLYEDERLFINMIHRLNEQVLSSDGSNINNERKDIPRRPSHAKLPTSDKESRATSTLRSLVEENEKKASPAEVPDAAHVSEEHVEGDDEDSDDCAHSPSIATKRTAVGAGEANCAKKARTF